jgi:hypothetical protein
MNIDLNTLCIVALSATTLFFAFGFVRGIIREKFNTIHDKVEQNTVDIYTEQEKMWRRIVELEKCCQTKCSPYPTNHIKNHYNTEA